MAPSTTESTPSVDAFAPDGDHIVHHGFSIGNFGEFVQLSDQRKKEAAEAEQAPETEVVSDAEDPSAPTLIDGVRSILVSKLSIEDAVRSNSGNYTCAPSNARATSVMVHVVDGNYTVQYFKANVVSIPVPDNHKNTGQETAQKICLRRRLLEINLQVSTVHKTNS